MIGKPETFVDASVDFVAAALLLSQHNISVTGARTMPNGVIRFYLEADHLPPGQVTVQFRKVEDGPVIVERIEAA